MHDLRRQLEAFLPALRLTLHPKKTRVLPVVSGVPFLGFVHAPGRVRLKQEAVRRFMRRMRRYRKALEAGVLSAPRVGASIRSWGDHASYGQTYRLRAALFDGFSFGR